MAEHRTKPLNRQALLDELTFVGSRLMQAGTREAQVSFGWDCNIPIEDMWQEHGVRMGEIPEFIRQAEQARIVDVGRGDIFVESQDFCLTLCQEDDVHVAGTADLVHEMVERWQRLGCEPYEVAST